MNKSTKLLRSILLTALIIVGAILIYRIVTADKSSDAPAAPDAPEAVANESAPPPVERVPDPGINAVVGAWDYTVHSDQGQIKGVLLFAGTGQTLTGTMANQAGSDALQHVEYNAPKLTFALPSGETFSTVVTGNTLAGTMNMPGMNSMRIEAKKQE